MRWLLALVLLFGLSAQAQTVGNGGGSISSAQLPPGLVQVLGSLRGANFNTTADQPIAIRVAVAKFVISSIVVTNCVGSMTLAVGGFYPTTAKGGAPIVAAGQAYSALSSAGVLLPAVLSAAALTTAYSISNVYLALTTAAGSAATCDVYVVGTDLT